MTEDELDAIRQHSCEAPEEMKEAWRLAGVRIMEILAKENAFDCPLA